VKLTRLSLILLMALALLGGRFAVAQEAAADECKEDCAPVHDCKVDCKAEEEEEAAGPAVVILGGTVTNSTTLDVSANGGLAVADGSGGSGNIAVAAGGDLDADVAAAGNGGSATANANGGAVVVGDVNSGGNSGNTIVVGNTNAPDDDHECKDCPKHEPEKPVCDCPKPHAPKAPDTGGKKDTGGGKVTKLAATGVGAVQGESGANAALVLLATLGAVAAAAYGLRRRFV